MAGSPQTSQVEFKACMDLPVCRPGLAIKAMDLLVRRKTSTALLMAMLVRALLCISLSRVLPTTMDSDLACALVKTLTLTNSLAIRDIRSLSSVAHSIESHTEVSLPQVTTSGNNLPTAFVPDSTIFLLSYSFLASHMGLFHVLHSFLPLKSGTITLWPLSYTRFDCRGRLGMRQSFRC
ncbi:hypothetical protein AOQ84DRAFT_28449 [Glonium stellatum]|uniref:Uncharacterized protein n=1 Tax=Glonium stellatum TaxID=574774 RepID=A0A8E2JU06_9PEZI|nr:hypothetical protein AOQ84DRAFT_28449 [Glonium stellatum]